MSERLGGGWGGGELCGEVWKNRRIYVEIKSRREEAKRSRREKYEKRRTKE
jgi:hypothetical protein